MSQPSTSEKLTCQLRRRYSPSVITGRPIDSCRATTSRMARSWTARSSVSGSSRRANLRKASLR